MTAAEAALDGFRRRNNLAEPEAQLGSALSLRAGLEAQLQAKLVELETLQRFEGRTIRGSSRSSRKSARSAPDRAHRRGEGRRYRPNVAGLSRVSGEYLNLYRDYRFAQALYEVYAHCRQAERRWGR